MKHIIEKIIAREIEKLEELSSSSDVPLDRNQAAMLNDYMKTLNANTKEERETVRNENLVGLSDDDLESQIKEMMEKDNDN